jgi:hypothetical protein
MDYVYHGGKYGDASVDDPWSSSWDDLYQGGLQDTASFDGAWQDDASWNAWMSEALKASAMLPPQMIESLRARAAASYFDQGPFGAGGSLWDRGTAGARFAGGAPGLGHAATDAQQRKVFVGGVPQDMEAKDLIEMFGEYGDVQQAWVQRFRKNAATKNGTKHSHRGFGFVVFLEPASVYRLLGLSPNRMLSLKDGRRLEVKRAVSSSALKAYEVDPAESSDSAPAKVVHNI